MKRLSSFATLLLIIAVCTRTSATVHDITIGNNFFSPLKTTVTPGDTVRWTWAGGVPHSTTSTGGSPKSWDSGVTSAAGFTFEVAFTAGDGPGPFPYVCTIHGGMRDTIFVAAAPGCCVGTRGNVVLDLMSNCETITDQSVDVGDLTNLIDHLFINFTPICCSDEADIAPALPDGSIDVGDLTAMIDHLFINFPPLSDCN
ncbi:MAG: hypothetical protein KKA42_07720 [candidate division Zixibacteria bacterium]|nr:hypothetical protein [candidate division Zixibacteria bacterium]